MSKQIIHTSQAPAAVGPYIGLVPETGLMVSEAFEPQVRQAFANMKAVIEAAGGRLENIVKLTLFLTDLKQFPVANSIMAELIPEPFPARSTVGVSSLPKDAQFEVEAIIVI